ncbi:MAG TPA: octaprenyl-diphosphate synthase, partial [Alphaproteobacteria bacterium]|nr:octaprenyl-diphosphate synthase [Alphaproteobacteria bacterium]
MSRPAPAPAPESANPFLVARDLAAPDMREVDRMIRQRLHSDVVLINAIGEHIVGGGGKRLRPMLHVLAAHAAGYQGDAHIEL